MPRRAPPRPSNPFDRSIDPHDPLDPARAGARLARTILGPVDRMLCQSKSCYRAAHRDHVILFNANLVTESRGKIWFGDLDLTIDRERLLRLADSLGEPLYVLREFDARFRAARDPALHQAVTVIAPSAGDAAHGAGTDPPGASSTDSARQSDCSGASDAGAPSLRDEASS